MFRKILLFALLFVPMIGFAEEATEEEKEKEEAPGYYVLVEEEAPGEETALTPTKLPVQAQMTPASIGIVERSLIQSQNATTLSDALKNVAGINIQSGFGIFDSFSIRGMDSLSSALVLTDGASEPEVTSYQLYNVDRVEVLKGPAAFLYGGNPMSGAVHLIRKQPLFQDSVQINASYGSFDTFRSTIDWNLAPAGYDCAFRVNGVWQESNFYRDDKYNRLYALNPVFSWRPDDQSTLLVNFEYTANEFKPDAGIPVLNNEIAPVPRTNSYQSSFDVSNQDIYRLRLDYERRISETWSLRNKFYYTDLDWKSDGTILLGVFPNGFGGNVVARTQTFLDDRQKLAGNQLEAIARLQIGTLKHELLTGFEISRLGDNFTLDVGNLPFIDLAEPVDTSPADPMLIPGVSQAGDTRSLVFAPYFVDRVSFSEKVQIFAGGRFDIVDYDDQITNTSRNDKKFSPLLGLVVSPRHNLSLYANWGRAFAPPSTLVVGDREPEESMQFETGLKKQFYGGKLATGAAFYYLDRQNIAIPDQTGVSRQNGDQKSRGLEFEISGRPSQKWQTFFTYAYNDSEFTNFSEIVFTGPDPFSFVVVDRTGNTPAFAPKHILNLWVQREFSNGIQIGGGPRYVSSQFVDPSNMFEVDGYLLWDAYTAYQKNSWRFQINLRNLTDRKYELPAFRPGAVVPGNPFEVYASVDFKL